MTPRFPKTKGSHESPHETPDPITTCNETIELCLVDTKETPGEYQKFRSSKDGPFSYQVSLRKKESWREHDKSISRLTSWPTSVAFIVSFSKQSNAYIDYYEYMHFWDISAHAPTVTVT